MNNPPEQRHFTRIPFDARIRIIQPEDSQSWNSDLLDISLNGALVTRPEDWSAKMGDAIQLELQLGEDPQTYLHMDTTVAHIEDTRVGLHCKQMDLDTATHLHRLLELNLGDPELLKRELSELIQHH
ncbi:MAG: PilZ domain-containing protein [Gammaproteobacteria bacterium]|nr:PilZ domain-containing protein [Gammaproteobacteria bacterium]